MVEECTWWDVSGMPGEDGQDAISSTVQADGSDGHNATMASSGCDSGDLTVTLFRQSDSCVLVRGTRKLRRQYGTNSNYYMRVSAALNIPAYSSLIDVVLPPQTHVTIHAIGGDGGHGANGSDGGTGKNGTNGTAATKMTPASDGTKGGPGGCAGRGSSGGNGGNGGNVEVRVAERDMDLLCLVQVNLRGGSGGRSGRNGSPGVGGLGGKGGAGICWVERSWNGWGWDKITHTILPGRDGPCGSVGAMAEHTPIAGCDGMPGKCTYIVEYDGDRCIEYATPFDLRVDAFRLSNPNKHTECDNRWSPHDTIAITHITVKNHGSMPTPRHTSFCLRLDSILSSSSFINSNSSPLMVPTYILPGETVTLCCELYLTVCQHFEVGGTTPWRRNETLRLSPYLFDGVEKESNSHHTHHHFQQTVLLGYEMELSEFATCDAMYTGQRARWSCVLSNCTSKPFHRRVVVRIVSCKDVVLLNNDSDALWTATSDNNGMEREFSAFAAEQQIKLCAVLQVPKTTPCFQSSSFVVELWLEDAKDLELHCIQRHVQMIRTCPIVDIRVDTDVLLIGDEYTSRSTVEEWMGTFKSLGLRCAAIDTTMEGGIPWAKLEHQRCAAGSAKTLLILSSPLQKACLPLGEPNTARRMMRSYDFRIALVQVGMVSEQQVRSSKSRTIALWQEFQCVLTGPDHAETVPKLWESVDEFWDSLQAVEHGTSAAETRACSLIPEFHRRQDHHAYVRMECDDVSRLRWKMQHNFPYRSFQINHLRSDMIRISFGLDYGTTRWMISDDISTVGHRVGGVIAALPFKRKMELWKDLIRAQRDIVSSVETGAIYSHELFCLGECIIMDLSVEQLTLEGNAIVLEVEAWRRRLSLLDEFLAAVRRERTIFAHGVFYSTLVRILAAICEIADAAVKWIDYAKHLTDPQSSLCIRSAVEDACNEIVTCVTQQAMGHDRLQMIQDIRAQRRAMARGNTSPNAARFVSNFCEKYALTTDHYQKDCEPLELEAQVRLLKTHHQTWKEHQQRQAWRATFIVTSPTSA